jgi:hypothetical protein
MRLPSRRCSCVVWSVGYNVLAGSSETLENCYQMIRHHVRCDCNLPVSRMCPYNSAQEQNSWKNRSVLFLRWKGGEVPTYLGPVDTADHSHWIGPQFSPYSDGLRAVRPGFASQQGKISLFFTPSRLALWPTQSPIHWVPERFLPRVKEAGAWSWPLISTWWRGQERRSLTSTLSYVCMARCLIN